MNKKTAALLFFVVLILSPLAYSKSVLPNISLKFNAGVSGICKSDYVAPIYINIKNMTKNIIGKLQVEVPNIESKLDLYETDIKINKGEQRTFKMYIPFMSSVSSLKIKLIEGGSVFYSKNIKVNNVLSSNTYLIGNINGSKETMERLERITVKGSDNEYYDAKAVNINGTDFPDNLDSLKMFDAIIINENGSSKLSSKQLNLLNKWQITGGTLLDASLISKSKIITYLKRKVAHIYQRDSKASSSDYRHPDNYSFLFSALKNIPDLKRPQFALILALLTLYILIVGPVNYIIMKRLDRKELIWISVPSISVLFAIILYMSIYNSDFFSTNLNEISIINSDKNGNCTIDTFGGVITNSNKKVTLKGNGKLSISPIGLWSYDDSLSSDDSYEDNGSQSPSIPEAKINISGHSQVKFFDNQLFSIKVLKLKDENINLGPKGISCSLTYNKGAIKGTIKNNSGYSLNQSYVLVKNNYIPVGKIKNNASKTINIESKPYGRSIQDFVDTVYGNNDISNKIFVDMNSDQLIKQRENSQLSDILSYYYWENEDNFKKPLFISFSSKTSPDTLLIDGQKIKKHEIQLITAEINMKI